MVSARAAAVVVAPVVPMRCVVGELRPGLVFASPRYFPQQMSQCCRRIFVREQLMHWLANECHARHHCGGAALSCLFSALRNRTLFPCGCGGLLVGFR